MHSARRHLATLEPQQVDPANRALLFAAWAVVEGAAGRMSAADSWHKKATAVYAKEAMQKSGAVADLALHWLERGEVETADRITRESFSGSEPHGALLRCHVEARIALAGGNVERSLQHAGEALRMSERYGLDSAHVESCGLLAGLAVRANEAERLSAAACVKLAAELSVAQDISTAMGTDSLPWYRIRLLEHRADLLIRTERRAEALDLARRALELARSTCEDLIPETGRALSDNILRAVSTGEATPGEALSVLTSVEPEAEPRGMIKELAEIRAARILALVLQGEPPTVIEPAMAALRDALERTGAPRIKAETLQDLAIRLPPTTTAPDPLALAGEALALFVEMPMPAKEARSLELSADVLAARGKVAEARRRYLTAKGILERRGLDLRVPLLISKIEALG